MSIVLQTIMDMAGENFQLVREDNFISELKGLKNLDHVTNRKYIAFFPETEIKNGDWIKAVSSEELYYIEDIDVEMAEEQPFQKRAFYLTRSEYDNRNVPKQPNSSETTAEHNITPDMTALQTAINCILSAKQNDLEQLIPRVSELLQQETIAKGSLREFSNLLSSNPWLAEIAARYILEWITSSD